MTDQSFMEWARDYCDRVNERWADHHFPGELPDKDLLPVWQLINHLHKWIIGWEFPSGTGPSRNHRIRFVAVQFGHRSGEIKSEAKRYAAELYRKALEQT